MLPAEMLSDPLRLGVYFLLTVNCTLMRQKRMATRKSISWMLMARMPKTWPDTERKTGLPLGGLRQSWGFSQGEGWHWHGDRLRCSR